MKKVVNVAFSGSGLLYPTFIGALLCLDDHGIDIAEISGTSGGSIIAAAYASGLQPRDQIVELAKNSLPFWNWLIDPSIRVFKNLGLIKGNKIQAVLEKNFIKTLGDAKIPLYITTSNVSKKKLRIFSSKTDPLFSTSLAVRTSIAVPIVFAPTIIDNESYVDGGILLNLPVDVFKNNLPTIAFKFHRKGIIGTVKSFFSLISGILEMMLSANEGESIEDAPKAHIIKINTAYSAGNFFVSKKDVDKMIQEGYQSTKEWLIIHASELFEEFEEITDEDIIESTDF